MKLASKDIILIAVITVLSFPLVYIAALFATGNAQVEFTRKVVKEDKSSEELQLLRMSHRRDSLAAQQSESFKALEKERQEIDKEREELKEQAGRVAMVQQDLEQQRTELAREREKLEKAVADDKSASDKKLRQLSRLYGAMRPAEAARILETLNDDLALEIISGMSDDRQKAKVMSAMSPEKAARISAKMGKPEKK